MPITRSGTTRANVRKWRGTEPNALVGGLVDAVADVTKIQGTSITVTVAGMPDANVAKWGANTPNALIGGRVDANAQVVGDKTGYSLTAGSYVVRASSTQRGTVAFATEDTSLTLSIASVTTTRASAAGSGRGPGTSTDAVRGLFTCQITAATTVTLVRGVGGDVGTGAAEVWELF